MTYAQNILSNSMAVSANLCVASQKAAHFYGDAALQSAGIVVNTPFTFFDALSRAMEVDDVAEFIRAPVSSETEVLEPDPIPEGTLIEPEPVEAEPVLAEPEIVEPVKEVLPEPEPATEMPVVETPQAGSPALLEAPRDGKADDLTEINGIGPKLAADLMEFGIYHYDQIADLDPDGIAWIDSNMPGFKRRCERYEVIASASALL